ncbi:hypothetical protein D043_1668A, partial [Vibrio parahaemolyticus EKP-021]
MSRCHQC